MRLIRRIVALLALITATILFCNLNSILPEGADISFIFDIQLVPALLSASIITIVSIALLTLILGRSYCSIVCPLGILQDIITRVGKRFNRKKRVKVKYREPNNYVRYSILTVTILASILGSSFLLLILDPYSIFGRISTTLGLPIITFANNSLAYISNSLNSYLFVTEEYPDTSLSLSIITAITFGSILYLAVKKGRLWCNMICPVGTTLGLLSRWSLLKIDIDSEKCIGCSACAKVCKSNTIDNNSNYSVDYSRCVTCFNCIESCKKGAIKYTYKRSAKREITNSNK